MITQERPNTVIEAGLQNSVSFGIKQDGLAHIFSVLRNQLYSDKILAVIREYSTNATDAHVEAGRGEQPIEVTLPSSLNPVFKVRDFGLGLTDDDIQDIYAFYGESTKRQSNAYTGQLGLGSKSAFAYGDNFVITSFVEGTKTTYNAFIDSTQIGKIAKLSSEPTKEANGVEISFSVKDFDVDSFHTKAYNLFRYFKVKPIVHGADFSYEKLTPIIQGNDWAIYGQHVTPTVAIMGNIGYPIDNQWPLDSTIAATLQAGLELNFNIGDLEISASREKLQYTDRTKLAIKSKLESVVKEVASELNLKFQNCATLLDAHKLYGTVMDYGNNLYSLREMVKKSLKFQGKNILDSNLPTPQPQNGDWSIRCYEPVRRKSGIQGFTYQHIQCNDKTVLVENDLQISSGINNRIWNLVKQDEKKVYILSYRDDKTKAAALKDTGLEQSNFILLSSLPKISLANAVGSPKNTKHMSKEFSLDLNFNPNNYRHRKLSDYWIAEQVDVANDSGLYVAIGDFKFQNKSGGWDKPEELQSIVSDLKTFGIPVPKVYGFKLVKLGEVRKNKNMVLLWDYIAKELTAYFATNNIAQKLANRLAYDSNHSYNWLEFVMKNAGRVDAKSKFAEIAGDFEYMRHESDKKILDASVQWKDYFKSTDKPEKDLPKLAKELEATYPMFKYLWNWGGDDVKRKDVLDYVSLVGA